MLFYLIKFVRTPPPTPFKWNMMEEGANINIFAYLICWKMHDHLNVTTWGSISFSSQCYWIFRTSWICICSFAKIRHHHTLGLRTISEMHMLRSRSCSCLSPRLPFLPPLHSPSFLPSFLWKIARAVGMTGVRPALRWGSKACLQGSCPPATSCAPWPVMESGQAP